MDVEKQIATILARLDALEARLSRLEVGVRGEVTTPESEAAKPEEVDTQGGLRGEHLELKIGEFWLAQMGSLLLLLGVAFLICYPFHTLSPVVKSLVGYASVTAILGLARYWRGKYAHLSRVLFGGGLFLLYLATLRLHFFNATPVLAGKTAGVVALVLALGVLLYSAARRRSQLLGGMTLLLGYATALFADTVHFSLAFIVVTSVVSVWMFYRFRWVQSALFSIILAYGTYLLWLLNNPVMGKPVQALPTHHNSLAYVFAFAAVFATVNLLRHRSDYSEFWEAVLTLIHSGGFVVLNALLVLTYFRPRAAEVSLAVAAFFLLLAVVNWLVRQSRYGTAVYACFGYLALSSAILIRFPIPGSFVWLGWQSLLVLSTAIWFRNRIIVVVNFLIFLSIFIAYLPFVPSHGWVNLSYAVVGLASARVLNWQKRRLDLRTELFRNGYLVLAFVIVLYGFAQAVPEKFVSLTWLAAAIFYFAMSLLLHNFKYRWMGILTVFAVIIHVFVRDLAHISAEFRILLLLLVGTVVLALSFLYARRRRQLSQT